MDEKEIERLKGAVERFAGSQTGLVYNPDGTVLVSKGATLAKEEAKSAAQRRYRDTMDPTQMIALGIFAPDTE